jgi:hypothetical protein
MLELERMINMNEDNLIRKPKCKLVGEDGNVFNIIGLVSKSLKKDGQRERAKEWQKKAIQCCSYDEVLQLLHDYVEAE